MPASCEDCAAADDAGDAEDATAVVMDGHITASAASPSMRGTRGIDAKRWMGGAVTVTVAGAVAAVVVLILLLMISVSST